MNRLLDRLWNTSAASALASLKSKWRRRGAGGWTKIRAGVLKDFELDFPAAGTAWPEMISGDYDNFLYQEVRGNVRPGVCVWDVGAHMGYHSLCFAALGAEVLSFEPNEANYDRLVRNINRNTSLAQHIKPFKVALSNKDGEEVFSQSTDLSGPSMGGHLSGALPPLSESAYQYNRFGQTVVKTARTDSLIQAG